MTNVFNKTVLRKTLKLIVCLSLPAILVAQSLIAQEGSRDNLVSVDWLNKNLKNSEVVILDASPSQLYTMKHIPGAINCDIFTYGPKELPVIEIEKRYQSWGISMGKKIVLYDQGGTFLATRLLFSLDYYGFPLKNLYILDGGLSKWQEAGLTVTSEPATVPKKGSFTINMINKAIRVDLNEFLEASGDPAKNALVDALSPDWHFGSLNIFGRPGHIPHAILLPVADFYNPDKTFKSTDEIKRILAYLGIEKEKNVFSHCGGGIAASVPFFAIKYLCGYMNVKLFPGSQLEWASDQRELPFWTYDAPFLTRNAEWMQSWGGKMMRMYGVSQVSFIDVRTDDLFKRGHMQYALNAPSEVFRNNLSNHNKLAEDLGRAGVNASDEAVIISGGGLTKDAALAFVLLESLGQKKTSLFMDSADKWEQLGFNVLRDTTAVDAKKIRQDLSGPGLIYPVNLRNNIIINDPKSTQGIYPRVFIACGKNIPDRTQDGKVVHVPYTDLLNTDGIPKAAKDIWKILSRAGIPRYAEIVCYSDEPGEAAAIYIILKLMGYPDIKVLVN